MQCEDNVGPTGTQEREGAVHHPELSVTLLVPGACVWCKGSGS